MGAPAIVRYLQALQQQKGSDLHLASMSSPMIRINGDLCKVDVPPLTHQDVENLVFEILSSEQKKQLPEKKSLDFALKIQGLGVFRFNVFYQRFGLSVVARALPDKPPTLEELNLPPICKIACSYPNGLILVTGPTGSGKSTTLAAMINHINLNEKSHILTLEDPIEFMHETKRSMVNQRQLHTHFTSFEEALKSALREDPDVILVGEMRDPETIALAITAAETGHLVFGTLHTNSAVKSIDRIIDSFEGDTQAQIRSMLSESLRVVISQKLLPRMDQKGRIAVHDILVVNSAVSNLIREGKTHQIPSVMQTSRKEGMQIFDQVILEAVKQGVVSGQIAWEYANDKSLFNQWAPHEVLNLGTQVTFQSTQTQKPGSLPRPPGSPHSGQGTPPLKAGFPPPIKKVG